MPLPFPLLLQVELLGSMEKASWVLLILEGGKVLRVDDFLEELGALRVAGDLLPQEPKPLSKQKLLSLQLNLGLFFAFFPLFKFVGGIQFICWGRLLTHGCCKEGASLVNGVVVKDPRFLF